MVSDLFDSALCADSKVSHLWFSYDINEVEQAKEICKVCPVKVECFLSAWSLDEYYGTHGGISEFDFLLKTWKEAKSVRQNNRSKSDKVLRSILQEIQ